MNIDSTRITCWEILIIAQLKQTEKTSSISVRLDDSKYCAMPQLGKRKPLLTETRTTAKNVLVHVFGLPIM
jgi:hypothetical protein